MAMKLNVGMLCLVSCLAIAATAEAQPGRGRGFGGGFGGGGGALFFLTQNEAVQKDLALSSDKVDQLKQINDDYGAAMREGMQGIQFGPDATDADREKATKVRKEVTDKYLPKLKEALTADQFTRLQQINWQNMGSRAYSDDEVVKALAITKDQQDKIKTLSDEYGAKFRELFQPGGGGGGGNREKFQELAKEQEAKIDEVLTKDQKDKFASMKGKEFDVQQLRQFGRGQGGGGGGAGGGGGGGGRPKRPQPKAE
jgi:hypothetical protein